MPRSILGNVGGHVYRHRPVGRRRYDDRAAFPRPGKPGHRSIADRHVPLLETRHRLREGDRHRERTRLKTGRPGDGHGRRIRVSLHPKPGRYIAVPVFILRHVRQHVHRHRPRGRRRNGDRVTCPLPGKPGHCSVAYRHVPLLEPRHRLGEGDRHRERTRLNIGRSGDGHRRTGLVVAVRLPCRQPNGKDRSDQASHRFSGGRPARGIESPGAFAMG